jgi:hypothetical protein
MPQCRSCPTRLVEGQEEHQGLGGQQVFLLRMLMLRAHEAPGKT